MKAWVARAGGQPPQLESVDVAAPLAGEVRVRLAASGVCGSDLHVLAGHSPVAQFPLVLGHEGAGVVEEVGPGVTSVAPGDHVVLALYGPCLACRNCLSGNPVHCNGPARIKAITGEMADGSTRLSSNGERVFPFVGSGTLAEEAVLRASQVVAVAQGHPARRDLPGGLRGHHRSRRGLQHRPGAAGRDRRRRRLRRRRAQRHPGRAHRRRRPDHRRRHQSATSSNWPAAWAPPTRCCSHDGSGDLVEAVNERCPGGRRRRLRGGG